MKKVLLSFSFIFFNIACFSAKVIISTVGNTFSPDLATINQGDTIIFNVGAGHTATEVSQSTWNANGTTPNGSFNLSAGNNQMVTGLSVGTHYYVCQIHASMSMKGRITVDAVSGTKNKVSNERTFTIFPNPSRDVLTLKTDGIMFDRVDITALDGKICQAMLLTNSANTISISDLSAGLYLITAYTKDGDTYVQSFVKE